jgi:hypothetical protein
MSARDGRSHPAGLPVKQPVSQHGFKTLDVDAETRLGAVLPQSCPAEAAFLIGGHEASNLLKIQRIDKRRQGEGGRDRFRFVSLAETLI